MKSNRQVLSGHRVFQYRTITASLAPGVVLSTAVTGGGITLDLPNDLKAVIGADSVTVASANGGPWIKASPSGVSVGGLPVGDATIGVGPTGGSVELANGVKIAVNGGAVSITGLAGVNTLPAGTTETLADGTVLAADAQGNTTTTLPGGTVVRIGANGGGSVTLANGATVVVDKNGTVGAGLRLPDGTELVVDSTGRASATLPSGVGVSVGAGGKINLKLPANVPPIIAKVVSVANKVLTGESIWVIRDIFGTGGILPLPAGATNVLGQADISLAAAGSLYEVGLRTSADGPIVWFTVTPSIKLLVDANRDGTISDGETSTAAAPYRFWLNDDNDSGDTGGDDIPGNTNPDFLTPLEFGRTGLVHGARDLVDWFPVFLDIKACVGAIPPSAAVHYKLKHADGGLNFVFSKLTRAQAINFQRTPAGASPLATGFGFDLGQAPGDAYKSQITADGANLFSGTNASAAFLDAILNHNGGVILMEGRAATIAPLVLSVEKSDGTVLAEVKLDLAIGPVEGMFRHLNLHDRNLPNLVGAMSGGTAQPEAMGDPTTGFPDNPNSDNRWLIFVHGFNVGGQAARGWNAEMFKRCYWSGNKSRFVGVSWFGNPDSGVGPLPSDYHRSVRNAMVTAQTLAAQINALPGTKTIFGHSLGTGVISSAIADHGMIVSKALFVDSALARECYDGAVSSESTGMTPEHWRSYDSRLYASNWHERFVGTSDARKTLTWRNRFGTAATTDATGKVYHFYSSTEDVLAEYAGEVPESVFAVANTSGLNGAYSWTFQEKAKGERVNYALGLTHVGSYYWGWGVNLFNPILQGDPFWYFANLQGRRAQTPAEIGPLTAAHLEGMTRSPFFQPGWGTWNITDPTVRYVYTDPYPGVPDWIGWLFTSHGSTYSADPQKRNQLLAEAIPALSFPLGSRASSLIPAARQFDLPSLTDNWPRRDPVSAVPEWRHSDMREVAYIYQYRFFNQVIFLANQ